MIPKEVLRNIRRIEITTSRLVSEVFAGQYQSVFKGKGMEFCEVREYQPGDEIRSIDWNVTARTGKPHIKKFTEERELTVMLILDKSLSCFFGTGTKLKMQIAAELCSVLAISAIRNNDKAGLIVFTDRVEKFVPPGKGLRHSLRIVREALYSKPAGSGTDVSKALEYLNRVSTRRTIAFIISDFYSPDFKKMLSAANKRHDIVAVIITDPMEQKLLDTGIIQLDDPETKESFLVDTSNAALRAKYNQDALQKIKNRRDLFRSVGVDVIDVRADLPYSASLYKFFKERERRMR